MFTVLSHTATSEPTLGFQSLREETAVERLPLTGSLPHWLTGALVRVTPALMDVGGRRVAHWFDGLAMLNRFGFADGAVSYASRYLRTNAFREAEQGRLTAGFATDPCRSIFKRVQSAFSPQFTDNANVNLARIGERYIAMTETPMPVEFDVDSLETLGHLEYADSLKGHVTTAHPHHDSGRDELVNYVARLSRVSEYVLYGLPAGGERRRVIARLPVERPSYMHSFGMSGRHLILSESPLRVNPLKLIASGRPFIENYRWRPDEPARLQVIDRDTGRLRGTYETDAFFCFHHVNAFERAGGRKLVVDLVAYADPAVIDTLYLDEHGPRGELPDTELRRYVIDLEAGAVTWERLAEGTLELPRIDYRRRNARDYAYAYFTGTGDSGWFDRLVKVDVRDGSAQLWAERGCYPGEPIFVPEPASDEEDAGVILSVVLDSAAARSFLLVVDAESFEERARAEAPHHIPFGFHGQYIREAT